MKEKKDLKNLNFKNEAVLKKTSFASIKGGIGRILDNNERSCSNSGDCTKSTNDWNCTNSGTCFS